MVFEMRSCALNIGFLPEIFFKGGKVYCYANFFCYAIVFGPHFREVQKFSGGKLPQGMPPCPLWKKARIMVNPNMIPYSSRNIFRLNSRSYKIIPSAESQRTKLASYLNPKELKPSFIKVIPDHHGNSQKRRTIFSGYLLKYGCNKYQN